MSSPRVAVCVDKSRSYARGVLRGIAEYVETHGRWSLYLHPRSSGSYAADWLHDWNGDGVLAFIEDPALALSLRRARMPTVELFGHRLDLKLPHVGNDEEAIGRVAARHLMEREFAELAFAGVEGALWSERRRRGFVDAAEMAGVNVNTFSHRSDDGAALSAWENNQKRLAEWLRGLPKPVGIMSASDRFALRVLQACRDENLTVPEQVAVIGVDNDEETCRLADPPLSSVVDNAVEVGLRAASLLDVWMGNGKRPKENQVLIQPLGVATRRSTDVMAIDDPLIAQARRLIHERACTGLTVVELARALGISKSLLYTRYKKVLNRLPNEDLVRTKLARAQSLLRQTTLPVSEIATRSGFVHPEYLTVVFRRELDITPARYRRASKDGW